MHESSLVRSLIDAVVKNLPGDDSTLQTVNVAVGPGIAPASLRLAFHAAIADTPLAGAQLSIEALAGPRHCPSCNAELGTGPAVANPSDGSLAGASDSGACLDEPCPNCGSLLAGIVDRDAIKLRSIEVENGE